MSDTSVAVSLSTGTARLSHPTAGSWRRRGTTWKRSWWRTSTLASANEFVRKLVKLENNVTEGDPGLVAPQTGDFRLKGDSPALKLGFKPIPFDKIGLYREEYR